MAGLFVHYLDSIEKGKVTIREAIGPSKTQKTQPDEFLFLIRVSNTLLSVPLATPLSPNAGHEPNIAAALESFVLFGEVTNVASGTSKLSQVQDPIFDNINVITPHCSLYATLQLCPLLCVGYLVPVISLICRCACERDIQTKQLKI